MTDATATRVHPIFLAIARRAELTRTPKPWYRDGTLYASDARILVRGPASLEAIESVPRGAVARIDLGDDQYVPAAAAVMLYEAFAAPGWVEAEIPKCQMTTTYQVGGKVYTRDLHDAVAFPRPGGDIRFDNYYLAILHRHGVRALAYPPAPGDGDMARFRGDGFEGVLMPVTGGD